MLLVVVGNIAMFNFRSTMKLEFYLVLVAVVCSSGWLDI